ncbi:Transthyretin-like family-containing protein [Dirofilaria immitis]|nr:Transthyretin-like family-containing protein [Dirofilaria immitis]
MLQKDMVMERGNIFSFYFYHFSSANIINIRFSTTISWSTRSSFCGNQSTDDQLAAVKTRADGSYELQGGIGSIFGMDVALKIYHDCDDGIKPCQRKVVLGIPNDYVTRTSDVKRWFDAGLLNMQFKFPKEERSCIN